MKYMFFIHDKKSSQNGFVHSCAKGFIGLIKLQLTLMILLSSNALIADENPLLGRWEFDENSTKASFDYENTTDKIKRCFVKGYCANFALEYTENSVRVIRYQLNFTSEFWKYQIIGSTDNTLTIEEEYLDGKKYTVKWHITNGVACTPVEVDTVQYQQCLRKIEQ